MAYFGADLQSAKNIRKMTEILTRWELINELENHFINAKKAPKKNLNKYTRNYSILEKRENCPF